MNQEYFNESEDKCSRLFEQFTSNTNVFSQSERMPPKTPFDYSGVTIDGRRCSIELKYRDLTLYQGMIHGRKFYDDTLIIETHKYASLMLAYQCSGLTPLYINILEDGHVLIYNLLNLKRCKTIIKDKVRSVGYQAIEVGQRIGLYVEDFAKYRLIQRSGMTDHPQGENAPETPQMTVYELVEKGGTK